MTPEAFDLVVDDNCASVLERRLIKLAAREMAAQMVERHARTPQAASDRAVRQARAEVAEDIARSIEVQLVEPAGTIGDQIRWEQARDDAATARRIGQAHKHLVAAS